MIYYFSYGNWPLAYSLQLAYAFILSAIFIALFYHSKNDSGGRGSNSIGAAGAIFVFILLLIPLVLSVAAIALFYKDIAAGEPGIFNPFIKYSFILLTITGVSILAYYYFSEIYMKKYCVKKKFLIKTWAS